MKQGAVIVAAGRASRLGQSKAKLVLEDKPVLLELIENYLSAGLQTVVVLSEDVPGLPAQVTLVEGRPEEEMVQSIARGLQALGQVAGAAIQPVDAPFTKTAQLQWLLAKAEDQALVLNYRGQPGHPIWLPETMFSAVNQHPKGGLRTLLEKSSQPLDCDWPTVLADIDTPEDLAKWRQWLAEK